MPAGADVLGQLVPALNGFNNHILVSGHTDKRPLKQAGYDNWDLSVDRAVSVVKLLRDRFGLASDRLRATGYGDTKPIALGDDEASLAMNRRVEIVVLAATPAPEAVTDPAVTDSAVTDTVPAEAPVDTAAPEAAVPDTVAAEPVTTG